MANIEVMVYSPVIENKEPSGRPDASLQSERTVGVAATEAPIAKEAAVISSSSSSSSRAAWSSVSSPSSSASLEAAAGAGAAAAAAAGLSSLKKMKWRLAAQGTHVKALLSGSNLGWLWRLSKEEVAAAVATRRQQRLQQQGLAFDGQRGDTEVPGELGRIRREADASRGAVSNQSKL
jgi:hypothetical protein